jgi:RNA:NAD 2'-phosphotransferase (TPT1/KptA family)
LKNKYTLQWSKTLSSVKKHSPEAAEFLSTSSGLFHVEESPLAITVTVEALEEGLKVFRSQIKQSELNACFSFGFGKPAKVMFRLPVALVSSRH